MSVNQKLQMISSKFKELKNAEIPLVKKMVIDEIRKLAGEAEGLMQIDQCAENSRRRRQLEDILSKCKQIQKQINQKIVKDIGNGGRNIKMRSSHYTQVQVSKMAVRSIIMKQIRSSQLRIRPEQIEEIANKMQKNLQVMKQIEEMVKQQGNDLQRIDQYLQSAYDNVEEANVELSEAKQLQNKTRLLKFRMAVSGFFGMLGYKILGLPGMIMGFFFGVKAT